MATTTLADLAPIVTSAQINLLNAGVQMGCGSANPDELTARQLAINGPQTNGQKTDRKHIISN